MTVWYDEDEQAVIDNVPNGVSLVDGELHIDVTEIRPGKVREFANAFESAVEDLAV